MITGLIASNIWSKDYPFKINQHYSWSDLLYGLIKGQWRSVDRDHDVNMNLIRGGGGIILGMDLCSQGFKALPRLERSEVRFGHFPLAALFSDPSSISSPFIIQHMKRWIDK